MKGGGQNGRDKTRGDEVEECRLCVLEGVHDIQSDKQTDAVTQHLGVEEWLVETTQWSMLCRVLLLWFLFWWLGW
jgi:hypothetical protein